MTDVNLHARFAEALQRERAGDPVILGHRIDGSELFEGPVLAREDPSCPEIIVSRFHDAPAFLAQKAVDASRAAQRVWEEIPLSQRIARVKGAIPFIESQTEALTVRIALETGKTYAASKSEVLEVLEFLRKFSDYVAQPEAFEEKYPRSNPDIATQTALRPYGVFGVITPFNYPFALAAGPVIGALLAGNGAVIKTSDRGAWSGQAVFEMTEAMGLPNGLVNVLHGRAEIAMALVSTDADGFAFTGSAKVGNEILRKVAGGAYPRPVIAEMGGKNPTIVTDGADIEAAVSGIIFSAFDLSGQKCSATSRVLVTPGARQALVDRLTERLSDLKMADPAEIGAFGGPLVSREAADRHAAILAQARKQNFQVIAKETGHSSGYFADPAIIANIPEDHDLARDEHFVPLVSISEVADFDLALMAANAGPYGLAAGIYTGDREEARLFLHRMEAGCINVNIAGHATTGWWPGLSTFGGWKGSGSTGKQGYGRAYVQQFARQQSRKVPDELADLLEY